MKQQIHPKVTRTNPAVLVCCACVWFCVLRWVKIDLSCAGDSQHVPCNSWSGVWRWTNREAHAEGRPGVPQVQGQEKLMAQGRSTPICSKIAHLELHVFIPSCKFVVTAVRSYAQAPHGLFAEFAQWSNDNCNWFQLTERPTHQHQKALCKYLLANVVYM